VRSVARRTVENALHRLGLAAVAGVDEVGRGCLAGPVTAAAVVLDSRRHIPFLSDSKLVPPDERASLYETIVSRARAWAVASIEPAEIDRLNIHRASLAAMRHAVLGLVPLPEIVIVDAFRIPDLPLPQRGIVKGDRRCAAIAAASIVAKVTRDRLMDELHRADPRFGFDRHKGYATREHLDAVARYGYTAVHRRSFRQPTLFDGLDTQGARGGTCEEPSVVSNDT
jgi:ribonuclease HII